MLVDLSETKSAFHEVKENLRLLGEGQHVSIRIQSEEIFDAMHKI